MGRRFKFWFLISIVITASYIVSCINLDGDPNPNFVTTEAATNVTDSSATLNGMKGLGLIPAVFEYGMTTSYGDTVKTFKNDTFYDLGVSAKLNGLTPASTYHYRLKAGPDLKYYGSDMIFTTKSPV